MGMGGDHSTNLFSEKKKNCLPHSFLVYVYLTALYFFFKIIEGVFVGRG